MSDTAVDVLWDYGSICDVQTYIRVVDELEASEIIAVNIFSEITAAEVP